MEKVTEILKKAAEKIEHFFADLKNAQTFASRGSEIEIAVANSYIKDFKHKYYDQGFLDAKALIFDAELLRELLAQPDVQSLKFSFGLRPYPTAAGPNEAVTFIITGVDSNGDHVKMPSGHVLDQCTPCPPQCPVGNAGYDLIA